MYLSFAPHSCRVLPAPLNLSWKGRQRHLAQVPFAALLPLCVGMSALSFPLLTSLAFSGHIFLIFSFSGYFCFAFFLGSSSSSHSGRSRSCPSSVLPQGFPLDGLTCPAASDTPSVQKPPRPCPRLALTSHLRHSARTSSWTAYQHPTFNMLQILFLSKPSLWVRLPSSVIHSGPTSVRAPTLDAPQPLLSSLTFSLSLTAPSAPTQAKLWLRTQCLLSGDSPAFPPGVLSYNLISLTLKSCKPSLLPFHVCTMCLHFVLASEAHRTLTHLIYPRSHPRTQPTLQLRGGSIVP